MKQRIWESRATTLVGRVFGLGLIVFLFVYLQGSVVRAAVPDLAGDGAPHSNSGPAVTGEKFIDPEDLVVSTLAMNTTDSWSFYLDVMETEKVYLPVIFNNYITVKSFIETEELVNSTLARNTPARANTLSVAPGTMVDIVLSVIDEDGTVIVDNQNLSPAGEVETIANLSLFEGKKYEVLISTEQGEGTDYALMFLDQDSYNFVLRGTFFNDGSQSDSVPEETDHFWFFSALSGDSISFRITPEDNGDPYVELYDPDGSRMLTIDDNGEGEAEELTNYTLLDGGMYGIRVAEFDFEPMSYTIELLP